MDNTALYEEWYITYYSNFLVRPYSVKNIDEISSISMKKITD